MEGSFSDWRAEMRSMLQGMVLGSLLFVFYVIDLDENMDRLATNSADDTKIDRVVDSEGGCSRL